jgi:hypothetical protein
VPMAATVAAGVVLGAVVAVVVYRLVSQHRTAVRVRKVEESRQAGTLPPDVAHALEQASQRSRRRR